MSVGSEMSASSEFTCKCGKQKGWITDGEETVKPCPECGRKYKGVYNKKKYTIEAIEIKQSWEKHYLFYDYGYDPDFKTGFIVNSVSFAIAIKGYWIGIKA